MKRIKNNQFRRGAVLLYSLYLMIIMMAVLSLAVDFGRRQMIRTEMQRTADATAHAALELYISGTPIATLTQSYLATRFSTDASNNLNNPVDYASGVTPTFIVNWGWWNTASKTFSINANPPTAGYQQAIQVIVSRTAANNNAMPLTFPLPSATHWIHTSTDIWTSSIAVVNPPATKEVTISGLYNPWLAGMPDGSSLSYGPSTPGNDLTDEVTTDATNNGPPLAMDVTPGTYITFTGPTGSGPVTGAVAHDPNLSPGDGPDGESTSWTHMQDSPDGNHNGEQNNIQTLTAPLDSLVGVFLGGANGSAPTAANAPTASNDYLTQNDNTIQVQEPFYIGDGTPVSGGSAPAQFLVPPGATQLYLGTMDGFQWNNNSGSFSATITEQPTISLVQ